MSDVSKRINDLSPDERRALLARLLHERERAQQKPRTAALSFAQERLYFLDQLYPGSTVYNIPMPIGLPGPLDIDVLKRCLNEIVRRHEVLRTTFTTIAGKPAQVIAPVFRVELPVVDVERLPEPERQAEAGRLATEDARRPFDLARGPLFRATLVRLGEHNHLLLLNMHHIVSDGWSMGVFFREFGEIYQAFIQGRPSPLPEPTMQYADFAEQQRKEMQGDALTNLRAYWKKQLSGAPPLLSLAITRPRPPVQTYRGANITFGVSAALGEGLRALSRKEGVTLFMTLLAAYSVLLHRYSGQTDIVVGAPIANRNRAAIEWLIGFFVNTLVLRTDLSGDPTFRELVGRVRKMTLGAYEHQDLPFEKLVEELQPGRDPSHTPLCQVIFTWQNVPTSGQPAGGGAPPQDPDAEPPQDTPPDTGTAKFDLSLTMGEVGQAFSGTLEYNTDLFDHADIRRVIQHFKTLLKDIAANPEKRISDLRLMTDEETGGLAPADFPEAELTRKDFESVVFELRSIP